MIRALPDGHLHPNPPNLPPSGKFPTSLPSLSRRFMERHKRVSSGRHALRHYDHRFGEPWNGWKDWNKRKTLGKEEERQQKKQEFVGESSKFIAMDPASSRALFLPALYYTRKRDSIRFWANLLTTMFFIARLACSAFEAVFQKRQTKFGVLLRWLAEVKERKALRAQAAGLRAVVVDGRDYSRR